MPAPLHVVILAAGQGTRMRSRLPKVLHAIAGRSMLGHVLDAARALNAAGCHVVHGHGAEAVRRAFAADKDVTWVLQAEQKGTGHAVAQALPGIPATANVLILYGDVPLARAETLWPLLQGKSLALLAAMPTDPKGYGRIVRKAGRVAGIVEDKDANPAQRKIREVNTGILFAPARLLKRWVPKIGNKNAKGEYYLTDIVAMAVKDKVKVSAHVVADFAEVQGVNDPGQLASAERAFQLRRAMHLMTEGLQIRDPARFDLRGSVTFGRDCVLDVGVVLEGIVELGDGVNIGPYSVLRNVTVGAGTRIESHCVLDGATIGSDCRIGPFARLRPEASLADEVHIGNFVEVKKSHIGKRSKANHLAYLGDATVGENVNVGAGTITCNYDGANKHATVIEDDVFVGSNTQLVAPVIVRKGATIGAGSTITKDVPPGALAVCRAKEQKHYPNWKRPQKP
ncbi:MAG TPA: bifunctional UDP-N-acetylglucosamine diphosphorylase/glucosamine-1-phosphate N-acetyltransferase GlmU [Verrucomicrobiae bacterium]|nr:bifunctional UDP-N-acetylglucosamine diphosphorylase/glucosamine-1-phosphate N-acetyltransferase GlmU [Verrucomicrobiae bacterium]